MLDTLAVQSSGIGAREQESMNAWLMWRFLLLWHSSCMLEAVSLFVSLHQEDDLPNIKLNRADNLWWESFSVFFFSGWFIRSSMLDTFVIQSSGIGQESKRAWEHESMVDVGAFWFYDSCLLCHAASRGWSSKYQAQQSWQLVMRIFSVFFSRLICTQQYAWYLCDTEHWHWGKSSREHESMNAWLMWLFLILWRSRSMLEAVSLFVSLHQEDDLPNIKLNRADNLWWESFLSSFPGWFACSNMLDTFVIHSIGIGARAQESMRAWKHEWCGSFLFYDILVVC